MNFRLSRRTLVQAMAAISALAATDPAEAEEELRRPFWSLDQRHVGVREFFHVYGNVGNVIQMPDSKKMDDTLVEFTKPGWADFGFEVEKILSSGKILYRARHVKTIIQENYVPWEIARHSNSPKNVYNEVVPLGHDVGPWLSPSEARTEHGIIIRRFA